MKAQVDFSCFVDQEHPISLRTALKVESLVLFLLSWAVVATSGAPAEHICHKFWPKKVPRSREKPQQGAKTRAKLVLMAVVELSKVMCLCLDPTCPP